MRSIAATPHHSVAAENPTARFWGWIALALAIGALFFAPVIFGILAVGIGLMVAGWGNRMGWIAIALAVVCTIVAVLFHTEVLGMFAGTRGGGYV